MVAKTECKGKRKPSQNVNSTVRCKADTVVLVENDDKYDLELKFKSRHRQHIAEAKDNHIFQLWDKQDNDKYGFIPLRDQIIWGKNLKK